MSKLKRTTAVVALILICSVLKAQNEGVAVDVFEDTRVVNGQSVELSGKGVLKFIIAHRFGRISDGASEFFGFDQATMRIGLDYGIKDWLNIGIGRSTFEKTVDGFFKMRLIRQSTGDKSFPFSVVLYSDAAVRTVAYSDPDRENYFSSRMSYAHQLLIARKFHDRFSAQLMPSLVHRNLVATATESNDVIAVGVAPQYKVSKTLSISAEYYYTLDDQIGDQYTNSLALGLNIRTNGHVFQLHFGNSTGMIEKFFISETTDKVEEGQIHFGFNITRDFHIRGRKKH